MKLKKLKLENFKKMESFSYDFKDENFIEGKNGTGKSMIKDAIIFCLYNKTSDGSAEKSSNFIKNGQTKATVELTFEINNQEYTIRRERTLLSTKITLIDGSQSEEDSQINQRELESFIPEYELFQSVFNIGYFMTLPDKEKRDFILSLTPAIDKEQIFLEMIKGTDLVNSPEFDFNDIRKTHKNILSERREKEDEITRLTALIENSKSLEIVDFNSELFAKKLEEFKILENSKKEYEKVKNQYEEYNKIANYNCSINNDNNKIKETLSNIKLNEIRKPTQIKLNNLIAKLKSLRTYVLPEEKCPTCYQAIDPTHKNKVEQYNNKVTQEIKSLNAEIDIEKINFSNANKEWQDNERQKEKIRLLEAKIKPLIENKKPTLPLIDFNETLFFEAKKEIEELDRKRELYKYQLNEETKRLEQLKKWKEERSNASARINILNKLKDIFSPSGIPAEEMRIKMKPIMEMFNKFIPNSKIETLRLLKSGLDSKEIFEISVDGKDYSRMSLGEKTRIDIALSQIIDDLSGNIVSMFFLDNSEILDETPKIKPQFFIAKVTNDNLIIK